MNLQIEVLKTSHGNVKVYIDGYAFHKNKDSKSTRVRVCADKFCKSRTTSDLKNENLKPPTNHSDHEKNCGRN